MSAEYLLATRLASFLLLGCAAAAGGSWRPKEPQPNVQTQKRSIPHRRSLIEASGSPEGPRRVRLAMTCRKNKASATFIAFSAGQPKPRSLSLRPSPSLSRTGIAQEEQQQYRRQRSIICKSRMQASTERGREWQLQSPEGGTGLT